MANKAQDFEYVRTGDGHPPKDCFLFIDKVEERLRITPWAYCDAVWTLIETPLEESLRDE